jgi:hypothetical protein
MTLIYECKKCDEMVMPNIKDSLEINVKNLFCPICGQYLGDILTSIEAMERSWNKSLWKQ